MRLFKFHNEKYFRTLKKSQPLFIFPNAPQDGADTPFLVREDVN